MSKFVIEIAGPKKDLDITDIVSAPNCNFTQFVSGALKACANAPLNMRRVIQSDIATTLNCRETDLSFLWAHPVRGAEVLDCEIPDFRDNFLKPLELKAAAE